MYHSTRQSHYILEVIRIWSPYPCLDSGYWIATVDLDQIQFGRGPRSPTAIVTNRRLSPLKLYLLFKLQILLEC